MKHLNQRFLPRHDIGSLAILALLLVVSASWIANMGAEWLQYTCRIALLILSIYSFNMKHLRFSSLISVSVIFISPLAISLARPDGSSLTDLLVSANALIGFLAASAFGSDYFKAFKAYVRVMYLLGIISLVIFPIIFILPELIIPVPDIFQSFFTGTYREERRFFTLFGVAYYVSSHGIQDIWRNQSIFWEPGMLGFFSVIALAILEALGRRIVSKEGAVFVACIVTSFAPGAYALLALYLILRFLRGTRRGVLASGLYVAGLLVTAALSISVVRETVLFLFERDIYLDSSVVVRAVDFWLPYQVAIDSPFYGHADVSNYQDAMFRKIHVRSLGITNSVGEYFYRFGYLWASVFLVWVLYAFSKLHKRCGLIPYILLIGIMYQPIGFSAFLFFLVFLASFGSQPPIMRTPARQELNESVDRRLSARRHLFDKTGAIHWS